MQISIIIPTYNEAATIPQLLEHLQAHASAETELIVVDGGSTDETRQKVREMDLTCLQAPEKGRAAQMNKGAKHANGDILYFVHADSYPPPTFERDIIQAVHEGYQAGCYRFQFNSDSLLLKINAYCTRFDRLMCRGGDQTLFITRRLFEELGGYRSDYLIMEDFDLIERIQQRGRFNIMAGDVLVSDRKYQANNYLLVQLANFTVFMMYFWGCSQEQMLHAYKDMIYHPKF